MKKDEILRAVTFHFKRIEKSFQKIIVDFDAEDILQFRIEIKRLKAFFHLLGIETNGNPQFKMTKKIKTFHGYVSIIRNLTLHLNDIKYHFKNASVPGVSAYLKKLEKELKYWKNNTTGFMDSQNNFNNAEENIIAELPDNLVRSSICKFLLFITKDLQTMMMKANEDESLHTIHKSLEDLLFNWEYLLIDCTSFLPQGITTEAEIKTLVEMLSTFRDKCFAGKLLQAYYNDTTEKKEKIMMEKMINQYKIQKEDIKRAICSRLKLIIINQPSLIESLHS